MKRSIIFTVLTIIMIVGGYSTVYAQSPHFSIFDSFEAPPNEGEGKVVIHQSEALKNLVGTRIDSDVVLMNGKTFLKTTGYRIHAYTGNNQRTSKGEALSLQTEIKELFPDIDTYIDYDAPTWKLRVGNFLSIEQALPVRLKLQSIYPQKKNEIKIIDSQILLPLDN